MSNLTTIIIQEMKKQGRIEFIGAVPHFRYRYSIFIPVGDTGMFDIAEPPDPDIVPIVEDDLRIVPDSVIYASPANNRQERFAAMKLGSFNTDNEPKIRQFWSNFYECQKVVAEEVIIKGLTHAKIIRTWKSNYISSNSSRRKRK